MAAITTSVSSTILTSWMIFFPSKTNTWMGAFKEACFGGGRSHECERGTHECVRHSEFNHSGWQVVPHAVDQNGFSVQVVFRYTPSVLVPRKRSSLVLVLFRGVLVESVSCTRRRVRYTRYLK